jgi:hypothetical protein
MFDAGIPVSGTATEVKHDAVIKNEATAAVSEITPPVTSGETQSETVEELNISAPQEDAPITAADDAAQEIQSEQINEDTSASQAETVETAEITETETQPEQTQEEIPAQPAVTVVTETASPEINNILGIMNGAQQEAVAETPIELSYTPDMPVEDILSQMTPEEALTVVVDTGTCAGKTLAWVLENRYISLKWYNTAYTGNNNVLRAGAKLLLETYPVQQAS